MVCVNVLESTFKDAKVQQLMRNKYIALSVNISDKSDKEISVLKEKFQVFGPPGFVFIDAEGVVIEDQKFYGYTLHLKSFMIL